MNFVSPLNRRSFLKMFAAGTGAAALAPLSRLAQAATANNTSQRLLVVYANGGLRSVDFCDAYENNTGVMETAYNTNNAHDVLGDGSWLLPPAAASLVDSPSGNNHSDLMAIVRHVNMETAAHPTGRTIGLSGTSRSTAAAGSVAVSNGVTWNDPILSLSFAKGMNSGGLTGPVSGEPADLVDLFENKKLNDSDALHSAIRNALSADVSRREAQVRKKALFHSWKSVFDLSDQIEEYAYNESLNPGSVETSGSVAYDFSSAAGGSDTHALRFAAAYNTLSAGICPVATVCMDGFDTHDSSQENLCTQLSTHLAVMMDKLSTANVMGDTTILVVSDFDRTKLINSSNGSDHSLYGSMALFGNGIKPGVVDDVERGSYPGSEAWQYRRRDIWATIFDIFGISHSKYFTDAQIIEGLRA
jgi:uncharacterized protein (DUF1501 family)